jgi:hypothetical protein
MLTDQQEEELYRMTKAIYHHLGLDVDPSNPASLPMRKKQMELDILKWREKQANKRHER